MKTIVKLTRKYFTKTDISIGNGSYIAVKQAHKAPKVAEIMIRRSKVVRLHIRFAKISKITFIEKLIKK
jgi:hypothetical protein